MTSNIQFGDYIVLTIALLLFLYNAYRLLPFLLVQWKPGSLGCWFEDQEIAWKALAASPDLKEMARHIEELGFTSLGVKTEQTPLNRRKYRGLSFVAADQRSYADLVLHPNMLPASLYFYTPLTSGGMVFTRSYYGGLEARRPGTLVTNVPAQDFSEVLQAHRKGLEQMEAEGYHAEVRPDRPGRIAATYAFYASQYYRDSAKKIVRPLTTSVIVSFLFVLVAAALLFYPK